MASIVKGAPVMKRMKRLTIRRLALGFAFAALAIPAVGQAKPVPGDGPILNGDQQSQDSAYLQAMSRGNVYIPLQGDTSMADSSYLKAVSRGNVYIPLQGDTVNPYRSWGPVISDGGSASTVSPDDRAFSKATSVGQVPYSGKVESGDDTSKYAASAFALVLLAMSGITLVVWRNRKGGKLSPA
jgi:hypothetical protein